MPKQGNPYIKLLPRDVLALFGAYNLKDPYEAGRIALSPQKIQLHDDWNPNLASFDADIAIITFEAGTITFSAFVQPICLWNEKTPPIQTEGYVGGWGQSQNLEKLFEEIPTKLEVPIHNNEFCFLTSKDLVDIASNRTFCAGRGDGKGICDGDSGGGVSIIVGSVFYFRGIVSSGLYNQISCDVSKYSVFTDVLKFKPWIDHIMREDGEILIPKVVRSNLRCTLKSHSWKILTEQKDLQTCFIDDQTIDDEESSLAGGLNLSVQAFYIQNNKEVKFLPENIFKYFPGLIAYNVLNCLIRTVNAKHFKGSNSLEHLDLDQNEIKSIDGDSFKDLIKLEMLGLSFNKIKTIAPNIFQSLGNLQQLRIGENQIKFLDEKCFDKLTKLEHIELGKNEISALPADLFKNNLKLEKIWFDGNKVQTISLTMFDHLKSLKFVVLNNNFCVNDFYNQDQFNEMRNVLSKNCTSSV